MASLAVYLDTHVLAWLHAGRASSIPRKARRSIDSGLCLASPMAVLELEYLYEIGRVTQHASLVVQHLAGTLGLGICTHPFADVALEATTLSWTRDPFDRLIVGQASLKTCVLITKDDLIRSHYPKAIWD